MFVLGFLVNVCAEEGGGTLTCRCNTYGLNGAADSAFARNDDKHKTFGLCHVFAICVTVTFYIVYIVWPCTVDDLT